MRKRDVLVFGGVLAVVIATAFVLTRGCHSTKSDGCPEDWPDPGLVPVLVATEDIQAGQMMDSVIEDDHLKQIRVPMGSLVRGAATDVSQIKGKTARRPIAKDEQISLAYLR
jgi:Flp pilus assembly protein CpaB